MSQLTVRFAKALRAGRAPRRDTRADLLAALLRQRATAHSLGDSDMEAMLREQIRWALPIEHPQPEPPNTSVCAEPEGR